jgi:hypothetical protein
VAATQQLDQNGTATASVTNHHRPYAGDGDADSMVVTTVLRGSRSRERAHHVP